MSIGNAHSHADSNTKRNSYSYAYGNTNSDATAINTDTNGNSNGHTNGDDYEQRLLQRLRTATATPTATPTASPTPGNACYRQMTVNHTLVPSTQSNFTVLVSVTDATLRTISNGGHVANSNGYDIGFYTDSSGSTKLKWEIDSYNPVTGQLIAWVKIPTLSSTSDTSFYLFYGDPSITTDQSDPVNTWDSQFQGRLPFWKWNNPNSKRFYRWQQRDIISQSYGEFGKD